MYALILGKPRKDENICGTSWQLFVHRVYLLIFLIVNHCFQVEGRIVRLSFMWWALAEYVQVPKHLDIRVAWHYTLSTQGRHFSFGIYLEYWCTRGEFNVFYVYQQSSRATHGPARCTVKMEIFAWNLNREFRDCSKYANFNSREVMFGWQI